MCAAFGKVVATATRKEGDTDEKTEMAAQALAASAYAVWCFVETGHASGVGGRDQEGARLRGRNGGVGGVGGGVGGAVLGAALVPHNVVPVLQSHALQRVYPGGDGGVDGDVIARAAVETLAFWGMCAIAAPKLEELGIAVSCDVQMEYDIDHRRRKGQRGKQGKHSKAGKKGKHGKHSTTA
ncbi:unnamed protein product [Closterium sp. Yama58-4]|nr:unnamed protein product [Closterium sp. Yama58-4]